MFGRPNKLKSDDDTSFQMCITGVCRADWISAINTIKNWANDHADNAEADTRNVLYILRNMQTLLDAGSDSVEIRLSPGVPVNRKLPKAKRTILRRQDPAE